MTLRLINILVIVALVLAAGYVYEIKFEATLQAERLAKMRGDIRRERDAIAALRAEWAKLENPARIQGLTQRHLKLKPATAAQVDMLDNLPERPGLAYIGDVEDPIGAIIDHEDEVTGSVAATGGAQ